MVKKKQKRKQPITAKTISGNAKFKHSRVETARLIRRFHVLNKELAKCRSSTEPDCIKKEQAILSEMEAMGGLDWYQKASQLGQSKARGGDSSKWLIQTLKTYCKEEQQQVLKDHQFIRVLDVGAVAPDNYKSYTSWIKAKPIDLNPQHPDIEQQDFLRMKPPSDDGDKFDIISLSLVINFVGDPKDRGQMLIHTRNFLSSPILCKNRLHYLFLVVPLPCITNSRYMTHEHLLSMMTSIGYTKCIHYHFSNKLAYYLFELTKLSKINTVWKKRVLPGKEGGGRNNFAVVIEK
ncbi:putative methyltransferase-domain-containing protein [Cokeromyces recurvatus]|uniref:putative methyltransferase-domain-containing protein n=1 Tax=Cokeromyces recurvatus TaxID=90255 RepID=UPI0022212160|nr:putative methyltransferase-domain-containing protein [Cokeromyces recurvatus]KAI7901677.1 putative methyltransferase-domain-containing protein [Cokeromyces recurvatus]